MAPDGQVTLWISRSEMGQGVRTVLCSLLTEELEVDPSSVRLEQAMPGARFHGIRLRTSGSGSSAGLFLGLRRMGAAAREMLISAAAQTWNTDRFACTAQLGSVMHLASGHRLSYGDLTVLAARQAVPADPPLKDPAHYRLLGKALNRVDAPAIVRGAVNYGLDTRLPGMLVAVLARRPYLGGKVASFDASKALAIAPPNSRCLAGVCEGLHSQPCFRWSCECLGKVPAQCEGTPRQRRSWRSPPSSA
ncbi:MAG TPA: molybdopterin cofactor-binding domain-containing protein [Bryobacteraceae bacterium]|nr:molybdopterin cofactor-binding domain-containing protein [Bryobacteraceae bacterium]